MSTTNNVAVQINDGDRVKLRSSSNGTEEDIYVYGPLVPQSNNGRIRTTMPAGSEVVIHKHRDLPWDDVRTSAAGANGASYRIYSFEKTLDTKFWRFVPTGSIINKRIPHNSLSRSKAGTPDQAKLFEVGDYAWVIIEHSWKQGGNSSVKVNKVVQIAGEPLTGTGQKINPDSVRRVSVTYDFKFTTSTQANKVWISDSYLFSDSFEEIQ
ncbi:hypothetical protein CPB84DRAFT_1771360 [Gymnopilus junonius]|uniref:Uncharacterized protein n=1 Tax=Gymnopilus junonius TaxID=109634 RepID=A0A9P5NTB0_GYMJU|nr:hypothetical protein CPB84DRAFT_1771360 [Gymnopilus junonius]